MERVVAVFLFLIILYFALSLFSHLLRTGRTVSELTSTVTVGNSTLLKESVETTILQVSKVYTTRTVRKPVTETVSITVTKTRTVYKTVTETLTATLSCNCSNATLTRYIFVKRFTEKTVTVTVPSSCTKTVVVTVPVKKVEETCGTFTCGKSFMTCVSGVVLYLTSSVETRTLIIGDYSTVYTVTVTLTKTATCPTVVSGKCVVFGCVK